MKKDSQFRADIIMEDHEQEQPLFHSTTDNRGNVNFKENEWYFLQLPQVLNMAAANKASETNSLRRIPKGPIGKLRIHKSGKVTMMLTPNGDDPNRQTNIQESADDKEVVYNLNHGVKQTFFNEMAYISNGTLTFLPKLTNKIVVSPDIQSML